MVLAYDALRAGSTSRRTVPDDLWSDESETLLGEAYGRETEAEQEQAVDRRSPAYLRWAQAALNQVMGTGLSVDGVIGPRTRDAVRAFQGQRGLPADGVIGPRTEAALVAAGASAPPGAPSRTQPAPATGRSPSRPSAAGQYPAVNTPLPAAGPGYYSYKPAPQRFGLAETIQALQRIGAEWVQAHPQGPRIGIGDISLNGGGPMRGHASHQRGVDVDIRPMRNDGQETGVQYQLPAYSRTLTQELVNRIRANGVLRVQYIFFNDANVTQVRRWPHHDDHLHVRFHAPGSSPAGQREAAPEEEAEQEQAVDRRSPAYLRWAQAALNQVMGTGLSVDGVIGPRTRDAVRAFQGQRGLPADGVIGPRTEAALVAAGASAPPGAPSRTQPAPTPTRPAVPVLCAPGNTLTAPERVALGVTTRFETGVPFGCAVSRVDGISVGMLQWNLLAGTLQTMLRRFEDQTGRLREFFDADTERLLRLVALSGTRALHRQAVTEALDEGLASRWRNSFLRLCADSHFCQLQMQDVQQRMRRASDATRRLGLRSVRGLTMLFDIVVGDGLSGRKATAFAARIARREAERGSALGEQERLVEIANEAADQLTAWREERRARRLLIARGSGEYRRATWNLDRDFPSLGERWE